MLRNTKFYKKLDNYAACGTVEGFGGYEGSSEEEQLVAWQYIYDRELYKGLQGWYGRTIQNLLENNLIEN